MTSEAWIIHTRLHGDTSVNVRFFTDQHGMLECRFRGGRTAKNHALLTPFMRLWLDHTMRYQMNFVRSLECQAPAFSLIGNSLWAGLYTNELLYYALPLSDPYPVLFRAYIALLSILNNHPERSLLEQSLRSFEWVLLKECGYQLQLESLQGFPFAKDILLRIVNGQFSHPEVLKPAKLIMRQAITDLLDGRPLLSRTLFVK